MKYLKRFKIFENKKFCGDCGSELGLKDRFCDQCGTRQYLSARPKSDDEKSVLAKLDDEKIDLKEKLALIIKAYEGDLEQHHDFDKKVQSILSEYQKKYKSDTLNDESFKKALKLSKKSLMIGTIELYKSKSQDPEYRKMVDSLIDEFHDKDVDDYDNSSAMMKALLLDTANSSVKRDKYKPWKDEFFKLANDFKKDEKGYSNSSKLMGQMIVLQMMISVAHKYPEHKKEFDKIFQEYLQDDKSSELLRKAYAKEAEIKKQKNGGSKLRFDSSGKEIK
jgi:hypothetical protein